MSYIGFAVLLAIQWWISRGLTRRARRLKGVRLGAARAGIWLCDALAITCYGFTFSDLAARLHISGPLPTVLGALALVYLIVAATVVAVYGARKAARKHLGADVDPARRRALNLAGNLIIASPFAAIGYGSLVQRTDFRIREIDVPLAHLPPDLDGFRVLQLSDIHLSPFLSESELARVIDASIELRPHLAVITGDLISRRGDPLDACIRQLARIRTDAGFFGCMGNHERYAGVETYAAQAAAAVGITFLRGRSRQLRVGRATLNLAGVDYQSLAGRQSYLRGAERLLVPGACNVLLSHNPDVFPVAARQGWNFVLAGHTHGGQVTVEILDQSINPARFFTPYVYGLYRAGPAAAYVTRGIGTIGLPTRIGAPPEISAM
ncbi:MAG: metallophosphoesterase, partial [Acidobacteriia bacterium]|nr:metallophosphoesterase [Terriglobia bacterium]